MSRHEAKFPQWLGLKSREINERLASQSWSGIGGVVRNFISIILGLGLLIAGVWGFAYMFLNSGPVTLLLWMVPIGSFSLALVILWEDFSSLLKRGDNRR